jgi:hypothetical protein
MITADGNAIRFARGRQQTKMLKVLLLQQSTFNNHAKAPLFGRDLVIHLTMPVMYCFYAQMHSKK